MPKKPSRSNKVPDSDHSLLGLPTEGRSDSWLCTVALLEAYSRAIIILGNPKTTKQDVWEMLDDIDTSHTFRNRLDRSAFEATPKERMTEFWNLYFAAVVTGMIRRASLLMHYEAAELVNFQMEPSQRRYALTQESEAYSKHLPALAPLEGEIPSINCEYLGMLGIRIEMALASKGLLPVGKGGKNDPATRAEIIVNKIGFEGLYGETLVAASVYLGAHTEKGTMKAVMDLGKGANPFPFMWHMALGHYEMIIGKLLQGASLEFVPKSCVECGSNEIIKLPKIPGARKRGKKYQNN